MTTNTTPKPKQSACRIFLDLIQSNGVNAIENYAEYDREQLLDLLNVIPNNADLLKSLLQRPYDDGELEETVTAVVEVYYARSTQGALNILRRYADPYTYQYFLESTDQNWEGFANTGIQAYTTCLLLLHDLALYHLLEARKEV